LIAKAALATGGMLTRSSEVALALLFESKFNYVAKQIVFANKIKRYYQK
jgi:hypothetical protein